MAKLEIQRHIRCLSAVPVDLENLLKELCDNQEKELVDNSKQQAIQKNNEVSTTQE